jgi:hypothetical protein
MNKENLADSSTSLDLDESQEDDEFLQTDELNVPSIE